MAEVRNIILIGRTGNGKSTLANVITGTNKFKESEFGDSQTQENQIEELEIEGIRYRIIDTIGIGDTSLTEQKVLNKIAEASYSIREGLNQILFVNAGKFTEEEVKAYNLLRSVIFDAEVINYTTIVRTKFSGFKKPEKCDEDKRRIIANNNNNSAEIISKCKVIHVNNLTKEEEESQESRKYSRTKLLTYLSICQDIYRPSNLDELNERIENYMNEKEKLQKELEELKKMTEEERKLNKEKEQKNQEKLAELETKIEEQTQERLKNRWNFCKTS